MGKSAKYFGELSLVIEDISIVVCEGKIANWEEGYEALCGITTRESKGFWIEAQLLQSNEQLLKETISFISSFTPPVRHCEFMFLYLKLNHIFIVLDLHDC